MPNADGKGWVNKVGGEVESRHRTKENAVERGRDIARDNKSNTPSITRMGRSRRRIVTATIRIRRRTRIARSIEVGGTRVVYDFRITIQ